MKTKYIIRLKGSSDYIQKIGLGNYYIFTGKSSATKFASELAAKTYLETFTDPQRFTIESAK